VPEVNAPTLPVAGDDAISRRYNALVNGGELNADRAQRTIVRRLDQLSQAVTAKRMARKTSALGWLFAKGGKPEPVRGLYLHGGVGRGKTMLMDLFYRACQADRKRRAHFNDFMADVHDRIHAHRQAFKAGETKREDPIPPVAEALAEQAWVLCFDEFAVTDIADAMILSRLFTALFNQGIVLVATSNVAPDDLYRDGLNRSLFLPFVDLLKAHTDVMPLDSPTDYRLEKLIRMPVYHAPLGTKADAEMNAAFAVATEGVSPAPATVEVKGRTIAVPLAARNVARFSFAALCEAPLGARDYLAIAERYQTLFIDGVPVMDMAQRNAAKRFILLIDTLYDKNVRLFLSADAEPDRLYTATSGTEAFEFARTASRLNEMRSEGWGA
jgi:cell division protein ZapE